MRNVVSLILGGGKGTRLYPLTQHRSKPAVPLAGKYRLIDIPISNCLNSEFRKIYLLTQFNSVSLHRHIRTSYRFDRFSEGFVEILAAQQTLQDSDWYQGTADAVRKNLRYLRQPGIDYVLILSGDQLYRMDYRQMLETHRSTNADVTISALPVSREQASSFGIMRMEAEGRVTGFLEKPQTEEDLKMVKADPEWFRRYHIESHGREYLASMGIYLFNRQTLLDLLEQSDYEDFGKEVFPMAIRARHVQTHLFDGYWEDIGTIRSFYDANIAMAGDHPPFQFLEAGHPIYSRARSLPPTNFQGAKISRSLIADGCHICEGSVIENSVIGIRSWIGPNVTIKDSIVMGADYYEFSDSLETSSSKGPALGIGEGCRIVGAIIDKNCRIGNNASLVIERQSDNDVDHPAISLRDGLIVTEKGALIEDGWNLQDHV